jgi:hypothetical protein
VRYATGSAFRMALEERLRLEAVATGMPLVRLRKTVAFDRLLARMVRTGPDLWLLKGGLALQLLIEERARTTKDVDVLMRQTSESAHGLLVAAALADLGDWFEFAVAAPGALPGETAVRMAVQSRLDGRRFESFHVDVGVGDPVVESPDHRVVTDLLAFADVAPTVMPCYPLTQHVAEKLHALTRPRSGAENSRVKDLVDVVLLAEQEESHASALGAAIEATFAARHTHRVPARLPDAPASWEPEYRRMARGLELGADDLAHAVGLARDFIDPILGGTASGAWRPGERRWR